MDMSLITPEVLTEMDAQANRLVEELAHANAENKRLRAAILDAANKIFFMPTWVEGDSYGAQIDMRRRCYEVVAGLLKEE